jgi:hypothetical protein
MATYYFRNTGSTAWGTATNWSTTDGGAGDGAVPTVADNAYFSNNSGNCDVNASARTCLNIDFTKGTGFVGSFTFTQNLTIGTNGSAIFNGTAMTSSGTGIFILTAGCSLKSNGHILGNELRMSANGTYTLVDNCETTGALNHTAGTTVTYAGAFTLKVGGNLTVTSTTVSGTVSIIMNGTTGTQTWSGAGTLKNNLEIASTGGTVAIGSVMYNTGTLLYTSGVMSMGTSIIYIVGSVTIDCGGMSFYSIVWQTLGGTTTLLGKLTMTNIMQLSVSTTFAGSYNIQCLTGSLSVAGTTHTFKDGQTLTITGSMTVTATSASHITLISSHATNTTAIVLQQGATQDNGFLNLTRIDANNGLTIETYKGTITDCNNVRLLPVDVQQFAY